MSAPISLRHAVAAALLALPLALPAQDASMPGMTMPAPAGTADAPAAASSSDEHAGHAMHDMAGMDHSMHGMHHDTPAAAVSSPAPSDEHAGHAMHDMAGMDHSMHGMHHAMPAGAVSSPAPAGEHADQAMPDMPGMDHSMHGMHHAMPAAAASSPAPASEHADHAMHDMAGMDHSMHGMHHDMQAAASSLPPNDHVAPPPPQHAMPGMAMDAMADTMEMDDKAWRGMLLADRLERTRSTGGDYASAWEVEGWYGGDVDRVWLRSEGERSRTGTEDARVEALWGHAFAAFWDWQLGVRHDFGQGPGRQWAGFGVQGLAPYWFEVQAMVYAGPQGRTAARVELAHELLLTQKLILQPRVEANFYGKDDPRRDVRSGLSSVEAGLRLRYEFSRRFAPYVGVNWSRRYAGPANETTWVAGVRMWF
ncbi:copper resistance protein B [Frateuria defendens]|uniref:copper resistance protein B n=1 Tax=Frateuria defendens TaxID=2219559 RepID=UPI00066FEDCA|nr:copper resistance protein B [Frateuria defendens]